MKKEDVYEASLTPKMLKIMRENTEFSLFASF